ncbi:MAG: hypothetical protein WCP45_19045 [Verrucomicrobiota bacterium]
MESTRYRLFRLTAHGRFVVAENAKGPLSPYRVTQPISHPWAGPKIGIGSIMLLSDATAEKMLAAGGISALEGVTLRPWRDAADAKTAARWEKTKLRRIANQRPEARG